MWSAQQNYSKWRYHANCMPSKNEDQNKELTPVQHDVEMPDFQDPEEVFSKHSVQHIANYSEWQTKN